MAHHTLQGYKINSFPNGFSSVIESWFDVIHQYEENSKFYEDEMGNTHGDAIYWYNERANVGAFAAALARCGHSVIEEFACLKGGEKDPKGERADLSFYYQGKWYLAEAKLKWKYLCPSSKTFSIKDVGKEARKDALKTWKGDPDAEPLALTFVVPCIPPKQREKSTELVKIMIAQLEQDNPGAFWAYCAPGRLRLLQTGHKSKNYYPMVILLAEHVEHSME